MFTMTRSGFCALWQCPKKLWLTENAPEQANAEHAFYSQEENDAEFKQEAYRLFDFCPDETNTGLELPSFSDQVTKTAAAIRSGAALIFDAAFEVESLSCTADILKKTDLGWSIYAIKNTVHERAVFSADLAYQKTVLERCGLIIDRLFLITVNPDYVFSGTLDPEAFFGVTDVTEKVLSLILNVLRRLSSVESLISDWSEPEIDVSLRCGRPNSCTFWDYCTRHLPTPSVFDVYKLPFEQKLAYYYRDLADFPSLRANVRFKNAIAQRQVDFGAAESGTYVNRKKLQAFLRQIHYPLYFLDFETVQPAIPLFPGTKPFQPIPFQFSLHAIWEEGGPLEHFEFLSDADKDPRPALANRLTEIIPPDSCVLAYNRSFECSRLRELAELFPSLRVRLNAIAGSVIDLLTPFQSGWYYNRAMGGSFSLKSVLPALYPEDPAMDYDHLDGIHNGSEAADALAGIRLLSKDRQTLLRRQLLDYCKLDTLALVKIFEKLKSAAEDNE